MHVDGVTVDALPDYLRAHWPVIREHLLAGRTFCSWRVAEASGERTEVTRSHLKFLGIQRTARPLLRLKSLRNSGNSSGTARSLADRMLREIHGLNRCMTESTRVCLEVRDIIGTMPLKILGPRYGAPDANSFRPGARADRRARRSCPSPSPRTPASKETDRLRSATENGQGRTRQHATDGTLGMAPIERDRH